MKLIDLHKEWMEKGQTSENGICNEVLKFQGKYYNEMQLLRPTYNDFNKISDENNCVVFWGAGLSSDNQEICKAYTPLRQTIVLLICAMNNEI